MEIYEENEEMMDSMDFDEDLQYECWKDDSVVRVEESVKHLVDEFLCELGGYFEGRHDKLLNEITADLSLIFGVDVVVKPLSKSFKRQKHTIE